MDETFFYRMLSCKITELNNSTIREALNFLPRKRGEQIKDTPFYNYLSLLLNIRKNFAVLIRAFIFLFS
jgi:hypothetical protein